MPNQLSDNEHALLAYLETNNKNCFLNASMSVFGKNYKRHLFNGFYICTAIKRSMNNYPWIQHFNTNSDPNWQVKTLTEIFLNIMSNFIPNEIKKFVTRDPPWITKPLKAMLNRKNRLFKNYKKHRYKEEDKVRLEVFRIECQKAVESAKLSYLTNMGNKVNYPGTSPKSYWKIINRVMNKCKAPKIPPLLINNRFILDCKEKAKHFNDFFSQQCKPIINSSVLPISIFLAEKRIDQLNIGNDEIIALIRNINPNKATGSDGISGQMLLLCDESVTSQNNLQKHTVNFCLP